MKIHEYQAKEILRRFGVTVPEGKVVFNPEDARTVAKGLGGTVVVKAQIHAGGRGKGGGVKLAHTPEEAKQHAQHILAMRLKTHQTGPDGQLVHKVLIEKGCQIARELYLGMVLDRESSRVTLMASTEGGVEIEQVAASHPEKILKVRVDPALGLMPYQCREIAFGLGLDGKNLGSATKLLTGLYGAFVGTDASLAEINPLVVTADGELLALDAKMNFDDNALFRHKEIEAYRDLDEEDPKETEARKWDLSYVALDGHIGCMVNGAGLAMATMDIIKHFGAMPANFLDVGGTATTERVTAAFKIIMVDPNVRAILVNIFGGIVKCDVIAGGVVSAAKQLGLKVPLVVRLAGTNVDAGNQILNQSGLHIIAADSLRDAAEKAVAAARG
ncbi:MAG: ADP-forming succinate--CoA ligase subunit beta [Deltaproteobacteria bacterium]|nr:ADP-forming succinate--CoA ligase subunit beta [Deltaproteobacteria bacterium]